MRSSSKQRVTAEKKKHFDCSNFERDIIVFTIFEKKKIGHHPKGQTCTNRFTFSYSAWKKIVCKQNTTTSFQSSKLWEKRDITNHLTRNDHEKKRSYFHQWKSKWSDFWTIETWWWSRRSTKGQVSSTKNEHTNESVNWTMANWRRLLDSREIDICKLIM